MIAAVVFVLLHMMIFVIVYYIRLRAKNQKSTVSRTTKRGILGHFGDLLDKHCQARGD